MAKGKCQRKKEKTTEDLDQDPDIARQQNTRQQNTRVGMVGWFWLRLRLRLKGSKAQAQAHAQGLQG